MNKAMLPALLSLLLIESGPPGPQFRAAPWRPHPDMSRREARRYLKTLSGELREAIQRSPDTRLPDESIDNFAIRMKLRRAAGKPAGTPQKHPAPGQEQRSS